MLLEGGYTNLLFSLFFSQFQIEQEFAAQQKTIQKLQERVISF